MVRPAGRRPGRGARGVPGRRDRRAAARPRRETGAACGLGPNLCMDGRRVTTRVTGTFADVINGCPLRVDARGDDATVSLPADGAPADRPTARSSASSRSAECPRAATPADDEQARSVEVAIWEDSTAQCHRGSPAAESLVSFPENFNRGWVAELDGRTAAADPRRRVAAGLAPARGRGRRAHDGPPAAARVRRHPAAGSVGERVGADPRADRAGRDPPVPARTGAGALVAGRGPGSLPPP